MEFVQDDPAQPSPGELAMHLLEDAIADNLLENATIASSEV